MLTENQIDIAALKLCELLQYPATETELKLSRFEITRRITKTPDEVDRAIAYALAQPDTKAQS